jgi:hypothetical protein
MKYLFLFSLTILLLLQTPKAVFISTIQSAENFASIFDTGIKIYKPVDRKENQQEYNMIIPFSKNATIYPRITWLEIQKFSKSYYFFIHETIQIQNKIKLKPKTGIAIYRYELPCNYKRKLALLSARLSQFTVVQEEIFIFKATNSIVYENIDPAFEVKKEYLKLTISKAIKSEFFNQLDGKYFKDIKPGFFTMNKTVAKQSVTLNFGELLTDMYFNTGEIFLTFSNPVNGAVLQYNIIIAAESKDKHFLIEFLKVVCGTMFSKEKCKPEEVDEDPVILEEGFQAIEYAGEEPKAIDNPLFEEHPLANGNFEQVNNLKYNSNYKTLDVRKRKNF